MTTKASLIDLNGNEMILDADGDTTITADTDDQIDIKIGGSDLVTMNPSGNIIDVTGNIRSSGNFIGNNSSLASLSLQISGTETARVDNYNSAFRLINFHASTETILQGNGDITLNSVGANNLILKTSNTERLRVTSGGGVAIAGTTAARDLHLYGIQRNQVPHTVNYPMIEFLNANGQVGGIRTSGTTTAYDTSSDYRLKENVSYDWDATSRLKQLKPTRFNFITDADTTFDGFLAHEVSDIVPIAVNGEKDAVYTAQDEANSLGKEGEPKMQGIDHSKLVPLLVKTIQELEARITTLEGGE